MRIGMIIYGSLDLLTGGWIYDRLLVEHLHEQGHAVEIISLTQRNYVRNLADNVSRRLHRRLLNLDCRLLLEDELSHPSLLGVNHRIRQARNCPIVTIVHQVLCRQPLKRFLQLFYQTFERYYLQSVDGFIFNSDTTRRNVASLIDHQRPAIVACPGGDRLGCLASPATIESKCRRAGPLKLIMVGNLTPNKGVMPLITGLSRLPAESWHLTIVGSLSMDRMYAQKVTAWIDRLGLGARVDIRGALDGEDLVKCLTRSHVFVLPFSYEGFGMACLEAMAWGLPVVGSTEGALKEFVEDGINGLLLAPGDISTFARHIHHLHTHRGLLADYSAAALDTFCRRPGWKDSLEKIHSFLLTMADQTKNEIHA
jgi:glycosyltransferase involved in cell wall biosynthesis